MSKFYLDLPNITGTTAETKVAELIRYVYQVVEKINWQLDTSTTTTTTAAETSTDSDKAVSTFNLIKRMIMKSEDIYKAIKAKTDLVYEPIHNEADFVVEQGTSGIWTYRKWNSGLVDLWGQQTVSVTMTSTMNGAYYAAPTVTLPFTLKSAIITGTVNGTVWLAYSYASGTTLTCRVCGNQSYTGNINLYLTIHGRWK